MKKTKNWVEITRDDKTFFVNQIGEDMVLPAYDAPNGERQPFNFIPYYGLASIDVIGVGDRFPSKGWNNIIQLIEGPAGNVLEIVFYTPCISYPCTIAKTEDGFTLNWERSHELTTYPNKVELLTVLMGTEYDGSGGRMVPANLSAHFEGVPNVLRTKGYIQAYGEDVYAKKVFTRECGVKSREHNLPFKMLLKMKGNVEALQALLSSLSEVKKIEDSDVYGFHIPSHMETLFSKYGIECPSEMVTNVGELARQHLEAEGKISNAYFRTIAIKNSKAESSVLGKSYLFKTKKGLLISRGDGYTSRRIHQGGNYWNLFNIQGFLPGRPSETRKESWVNFGTYEGHQENLPWLYESDLIPIETTEWEKLAGRKFSQTEYSWFRNKY